MCPMWGEPWTVAPHRYIPTWPATRGWKSRRERVAES